MGPATAGACTELCQVSAPSLPRVPALAPRLAIGLFPSVPGSVVPGAPQVSALASAGGAENLIVLERAQQRVPHSLGAVRRAGTTFGPLHKSRLGEHEFEALMRMLDNLVSAKIHSTRPRTHSNPWVCPCVPDSPLCALPGIPHGLHIPLPLRAGEEQAQERRADPRHRDSLCVRGGACRDPRPAPARTETAEGEDEVAQHSQHLHQGQPGRRVAGQHRQPEDKDHGEGQMGQTGFWGSTTREVGGGGCPGYRSC